MVWEHGIAVGRISAGLEISEGDGVACCLRFSVLSLQCIAVGIWRVLRSGSLSY